MGIIIPRTWVPGTPRGYGDNKIASAWLLEIERALCAFKDAAHQHDAARTRYAVTLEFRVWPGCPKYRGQNGNHGTDLDNLCKQTLDGIARTRSPGLPPGLNAIVSDSAVYRLTLTKEHVTTEGAMGVFVTVEAL